ncbi:Vitamin B12 transporter BtuB [Neolewinella maritima]|uniref:Vitamin B12 transporter BtuB n=1 Tax=Neolewinella maritima TaxID=1383882 RepID=A0ABM9AWK6_9BACT|nr:TonB-dependent receptor [Neolewinella maritima]CAH0999100.1 Vitamin B12 transporter BtuB [Neolewinella maritima]
MHYVFILLALLCSAQGYAQTGWVVGSVVSDGEPVSFATVGLADGTLGTVAELDGTFVLELPAGEQTVRISALGQQTATETLLVMEGDTTVLDLVLEAGAAVLDDIVVTGTMKAVSRSNSPVPVEVFTANYFRANPTPSVFESLQTVNGVRPQLNCAVCNTGDIHINGLEGPYTMVLIDGMPIVSGLSTVYGLTGIPQSLIERVEVVKGPASTLYGSEAVGGLINVITKAPEDAPLVAADVMVSGWGEVNTDLGLKLKVGKAQSLLGLNYFNYQQPQDNNGDGFTDVTLQDRLSVFNKWSFRRAADRIFTLAGRYVYEDRFGGQLDWDRGDRGGDQVYGESIYTNRWETFGTYQLPVPGRVMFQFSTNGHYQNSVYGQTVYDATQYVGFGQLTWNKQVGAHDLLLGASYRYTWYDDNTPATTEVSRIRLPGAFVQDELRLNTNNILLLGLRYDYNSLHGSILTPRLNYKWNSASGLDIIRLSIGNGYRVANVFTEDHAALTGAREVRFADELLPETSWNTNVNYVRKFFSRGGTVVGLDGSLWYTRFGNRILPDYTTDPTAIIYANLRGSAVSRGASLSGDVSLKGGSSLNVGVTLQDVYTNEEGLRERQLLTETFSGVWQLGVPIKSALLRIDYTGNVYGPMDLPLLGALDERPGQSPWFSTQNLQLTKTFANGMEVYGGVKNLLDYTPPANSIARSFDPFDRGVEFGADGSVLATPDNPQALTFDPTYVYASNQGRRWFVGWRWSLR